MVVGKGVYWHAPGARAEAGAARKKADVPPKQQADVMSSAARRDHGGFGAGARAPCDTRARGSSETSILGANYSHERSFTECSGAFTRMTI
eukprot:6005904-Prymnesium_polylepis.1